MAHPNPTYHPTIHKFRADQITHATILIRGGKLKRGRSMCSGCAVRFSDEATRLAPHHDVNREPPITCMRALDVVTTFADLIGM